MNRTYVFLSLVTVFGATTFACSDDETTTSTTSTTNNNTTTTTSGTGGSSTTSGTGGDNTGGAAMGGGGMGMGGMGMGGASAAFCDDYETVCGFGAADRFTDVADCLDYFANADNACQGYMETHLSNAAAMDPGLHCPHACGEDSNACDPVGCN